MEGPFEFFIWLVSVYILIHKVSIYVPFKTELPGHLVLAPAAHPTSSHRDLEKSSWHSVSYIGLKNKEAKDKSSYNYSLVFGTSDNLCNGFGALIESLSPPCLNFNYAAIIFTNLCKGVI